MDFAQHGKLVFDGITFELDDCTETRFFIFENDDNENYIDISFDISSKSEKYKGEIVSPSIFVQTHETNKSDIKELVGLTYSVESIEHSEEREDMFYLYEHEPMERYSFTILEVSNNMVHLQIEGTAVVDGYADPYETADFSGDFWLSYN